MNDTRKNQLLYMTKCVATTGLIFYFSHPFHYSDIIWCLISAILVLSPNAKEALPLALTRIAANFIGSASILLCLVFGELPHIVTLSLAYCLAISVCYLFNTTNSIKRPSTGFAFLQHPQEPYLDLRGARQSRSGKGCRRLSVRIPAKAPFSGKLANTLINKGLPTWHSVDLVTG